MSNKKLSIVVAICTCQRNPLLRQVLASLDAAQYCQKSDIHVLVVDNHISQSAQLVISEFSHFKYPLHYVFAPQAGIPFARNAAIDWGLEHNIDACIFIDDDETAHDNWLVTLVDYYIQHWPEVQVVTGPVESIVTASYPIYLPKDIHNKLQLKRQTGEVLLEAYTNNVIFDLAICEETGLRFDEAMQHCGGTDRLFFIQVANHGYKMVWNRQALVYEQIDADRLKLSWLIKRHARHGVTYVQVTKKLHDKGTKRIRLYVCEIFYTLRGILKKILRKHPKYMITYISIGAATCVGIIMALVGMRVNEYKSRHR